MKTGHGCWEKEEEDNTDEDKKRRTWVIECQRAEKLASKPYMGVGRRRRRKQ